MDKPFKPFHADGDSRQIGELTIESQTDRIEIYGSISITRDEAGLSAALALKQMLDAAVDLLKSEKLPDRVAEAASETVSNPFADKS
jgi:hypothetical protein